MKQAFCRKWLNDPRTILIVWMLIATVAFLTKGAFNPARCNNFLIYCGVFNHTVDLLPLYDFYPDEYGDVNHYGPLFSLIIAPFALLPHWAGLLLWDISLTAALYATVWYLPVSRNHRAIICWICTLEVLSALQMQQFNMAVAALVAATYIAVHRDRPGWAALFIAVGTLTKIYGIIALVFLPFSRRKGRMLLWTAIWTAALFAAPMLISSPEYICSQYAAWGESLVAKNVANATAAGIYQNISAIGMIHRVSGLTFSDLWILIPAAVLFLMPFARRSQWHSGQFQYGIVASALMCIILFSTGSESSGYIIAFLGVALWYTQLPPLVREPHLTTLRSNVMADPWKTALLALAIVVCGFGGSDLMPRAIRTGIIRPYSLKALPVLLIWLYLSATMLFRRFTDTTPSCRMSAQQRPINTPEVKI